VELWHGILPRRTPTPRAFETTFAFVIIQHWGKKVLFILFSFFSVTNLFFELNFYLMMDNLRVHHTQEVQDEIAKGGHQILFRPAYSPDFAPVELAFSKIKAYIRAHKYQITKENLELLSFKQSRRSRLKIVKIGLKHVIVIEK
jgi:hypothetical protein